MTLRFDLRNSSGEEDWSDSEVELVEVKEEEVEDRGRERNREGKVDSA